MTIKMPSVITDENPDLDVANPVDLDEINELIPGAAPLKDDKHEKFCTGICLFGMDEWSAYQTHVSKGKCSKRTAQSQANKLKNDNVQIKNRIAFLRGLKDEQNNPVDLDEAIRVCSAIIHGNFAPKDQLMAIDKLDKILGWSKSPPSDAMRGAPDPAWFIQYVKYARDCGGQIVERLLEVGIEEKRKKEEQKSLTKVEMPGDNDSKDPDPIPVDQPWSPDRFERKSHRPGG